MYLFSSNTQKHTHIKTINELNAALLWIKNNLGIRIINTRMSQYAKALKEIEETKETSRYKEYLFTKKEVDEILVIFRAFKHEPKESIEHQMKHIVSGTYFRNDSSVEKSEPARDYLHELSIAARLKLANFEVITNEKCDVIVKYIDKTIYIECKRIRSKNKLITRIKEANKQLKERMSKYFTKKNIYGYITVDVTDLLFNKESIKKYQQIGMLKKESLKNLQKYSSNCSDEIRSNVSKKVCGVIFYSHVLGIVSENHIDKLYNIGVFYCVGTEQTDREKMLLNSLFLPYLCPAY